MERAMQLGRQRLKEETNIIQIIKSRRYFKYALKLLLTREQRQRYKSKSTFELINVERPDGQASDSLSEKDYKRSDHVNANTNSQVEMAAESFLTI